MHIVLVSAHVKPEHVEAFREACVENAANSIQEPGVAQFDVLQQSDDPTRFVLYEVYRDPGAPAKHRETAHYNAWLAKVTDMFAEPRTRLTFSNVFPADAAW
jgi:quinol monooxygenase YgiN